MESPETPSSESPDVLGAALGTVTGRIARRLSGGLDRLLANVADLEDLEAQIAELTRQVEETIAEGAS